MLFNFTDKYQFTTRLNLKGTNIEIVDKMLRELPQFGASKEEMVHIWVLFCRSLLEQSCVVWHSSLTKENTDDLERPQKSFAKLVLKDKYTNYEDSLIKLNLESLSERRQELCSKF